VRDVLDAILYILCTGCQWRYLPIDFPPKSTVWRHFDQWRRDGTLDRIHDRLRRKVRTTEKPYQPRTSASVARQSIDTTSGGEQRGRENVKNAAAGHHRQSPISGISFPPASGMWRISER
jgi:putative transposase